MKILKKLTASALLLCMLTAMLVVPAAAAPSQIKLPDTLQPVTLIYTDNLAPMTVEAKLGEAWGTNPWWEWSSTNDAAATVAIDGVNNMGKVTPVAPGDATITVSFTNADLTVPLTNSFVISVKSPKVTMAPANPTSFVTGETNTLFAGLEAGSPTAALTWSSSNPTVATVDASTGMVTAHSAGSAEIIASYFGVEDRTAITVSDPVTPVITVKSTPEGWGRIDFSRDDLLYGKEITLKAEQSVSGGMGDFSWSADPADVISLTHGSDSSLYVIKPLKVGTTIITVSKGGCTSASFPVQVYGVFDITLNATSLNLTTGSSSTLIPAVTTVPADGDKTVSWSSSNPAVATVANDGMVTAFAPGETTITASSGGKSVACTVYVSSPVTPVISVQSTPEGWGRIDFSPADLLNGKTIMLKAEQNISGGTGDFSWSADPADVISLTQNSDSSLYVIKPLKVGATTITVSKGGCTSASFPVQVYGVSDITLNTTSLNLTTGSTGTLVPAVTTVPADGDKAVSWSSSNPAVATVVDGMVTAVAPGIAVITATAADGSGISASCSVTVTDPHTPAIPVTGITLDKTTLLLTTGGSERITASVAPTDATNKTVAWSSSDTAVATVVDGMVTAVAPGTAVITAATADGGYSASCSVTVTAPVTPAVTVTGDYGMDLVFNNNEIGVAASNVSKTASCDTATGDFTWAVVSGDPAVVALKISGTNNSGCVISPKAAGSCVIGVSRGTATPAYINVTVKGPEIESFTLPAVINMEAGTEQALAPVISFKAGTNDTIENRAVKWTISPGNNGITMPLIGTADACIISVAQNTPVNTEAIVTCTSLYDPAKTATCKIKVTQSIIPVTAVTLDKYTLALSTTGSARTYKLTAIVAPTNATNNSVTWTSGNSAVATVAADGTVTAIAPGIANITAKAGDVSAVCAVSVTAGTTTGSLTITPSPRSISAIGGYSELTASIPNAFGSQQVISSDLITWNIDTTRSNGKATFNRVGNRVFLYGSFAGTVVVTGSYVSNGITYTGQVSVGITPMLTYGNYSAYDGRNHMRFLTNEIYPGDPSRVSVIVDGYALAHGMHCYVQSAPNGYIMVTLNNAFLNTLNPSVIHTIQIGTPGNLATGYFRSYGHSSSIYGVRTGDESQPALWAALCIMSLLGAGTILISRRKDWKV